MQDFPIILFSEAPPLREGGHGCHIVAATMIDHLGTDLCSVVTQRYRHKINPAALQNDFPVPIDLHPDTGFLAMRRYAPETAEIASLLGACLYSITAPHRKPLKRGRRLFALLGGNAYHLVPALALAKRLRIPCDLYLVDDLEESSKLHNRKLLQGFVRRLEKSALHRADRVFAISPGLADHLSEKYGSPVSWLPLPLPQATFSYNQAVERDGCFEIVYIGGLNPLYREPLIELHNLIAKRNREGSNPRLVLRVISYADPIVLQNLLPDHSYLRLSINASNKEMQAFAAGAYALFLPYSRDQNAARMVATSFPSKIGEYFQAGRPIVVFGPGYGSMTRYFRENQLPLSATNEWELAQCLDSIAIHDTPALIENYATIFHRLHSPEALKRYLSVK